jgi:hypothetical protein
MRKIEEGAMSGTVSRRLYTSGRRHGGSPAPVADPTSSRPSGTGRRAATGQPTAGFAGRLAAQLEQQSAAIRSAWQRSALPDRGRGRARQLATPGEHGPVQGRRGVSQPRTARPAHERGQLFVANPGRSPTIEQVPFPAPRHVGGLGRPPAPSGPSQAHRRQLTALREQS